MANLNDPTDILLRALDPARGLQVLRSDLVRLADLDPKVREAVSLIGDRWNGLSPEEQATLEPVLWTQLRPYIQDPAAFLRLRQIWQDGTAVLDAVDQALVGIFDLDALKRTASDAKTLTDNDSDKAGVVSRAVAEIASMPQEDVPAFGAAVVIAGGVAVILYSVAKITVDLVTYAQR